jgi:hypothetical protein
MILRPAAFASCATVAAFTLASCNDDDERSADQVSTASGTATAAIDMATKVMPDAIVVELAEKNGSGQSGNATLEPAKDGRLNVSIVLSGNQNEPQPADLDKGSCNDHRGAVVLLNDVVGGASTTDIVFSLEMAGADTPGYAIVVRRSEHDGSLVACGDVSLP